MHVQSLYFKQIWHKTLEEMIFMISFGFYENVTAQKGNFSKSVFPVNVTKSAANCEFGHTY